MSTEAVIVAAGRTAVGNFRGALSSLPASDLGARVIEGLLQRAGISPEQIDEVIMGQVLTAGCGQNPARQASLGAGIPVETPAMTINKVCGSGLKAVHLAMQAVLCGDAGILVAGGQESMSRAPHLLPDSRDGVKTGNWKLLDSMLTDGLLDAFECCHMGITAENIASRCDLSREQQDQFAVHSQQKTEAARLADRFRDEIIPLEIPQRRGAPPLLIDQDEFPRHGTTIEKLATLRAAFDPRGTVTAGNASGINDGAAGVIVAERLQAERLGLKPLATIRAFAAAGVDPAFMGMGPIPASRRCLEKAGWGVEDLDLVEANEAFAAQALLVNQEMGWDPEKVNVNGGAIALGHPIGASGARILVSLLYEMERRDVRKGLATLCIGGGMGVAMAIER